MAGTRQLSSLLAFLLLSVVSFAPRGAQAVGPVVDDGESILISEIGRVNNQSLLWGPYRPNLYFGIRPRIPKSLMTGLMWGKIETYVDYQNSTFLSSLRVEGSYYNAN